MLQIGSVLDGKYKILSEIGHGGMSVVYMALNEKANKTWAVKEIRKDGKLDFNVVRQGLVAEIETLKRLKHPNLPSIVDVIEDDDTFIIVMDYIEGNSLDRALEEHGAQPEEYVVEWARQLCDVLGYLHSCNPPIIYRDMKPANIMLKPDGNIALIDFGTAKTYEIDLGETTGIGTIGYAAPEQYIGSGLGRTDARTDIYCLGITMYHLLTGVDPCKNVISDKSIRSVNPSLSPGLDAIIKKCTEPMPEDRYQSCAELLYEIEHHNEMGDIYRRKQKKKLASFITSAVLSVVFAVLAVFSFVSAEKQKAANYNVLISEANNPGLSQKEAVELYISAIETDPTRTEAYLELIDLFLSSEDENGVIFSREEAGIISELNSGIEIKNSSGYNSTFKPFEELKEQNPAGHAQVSNELGFAYWYCFEVEMNRFSEGGKWFEQAAAYSAEEYELAQIFVEISSIRSEIDTYEKRNRPDVVTTQYKFIWEKMVSIYDFSDGIDNDSIELLLFDEIINTISEDHAYILKEDKNNKKPVTTDDLFAMLSNIESDVNAIKQSAGISEIEEDAENLLSKIEKTKSRLNSYIATQKNAKEEVSN